MLLWSSCKINVKKCEGCAILPNLQGNKLSCHGCWQRHDTPGSEIKDSSLLTSITVAGISAFFLSSPSPSSHRVNWHWHVYWLCYRREGNPKFYNGQYACQTFGPRKRHHFFFFLSDTKQTHPLLHKEILYLPRLVPTNILDKIFWKKGTQCLYFQDLQKCKRPMENCGSVINRERSIQIFIEWLTFSYYEDSYIALLNLS